jgi:addiction module HigA family antidote
MIKTLRSRGAELLLARKSVALFHRIERARGIEPRVRRKLAQLNAAAELRDLAVPADNCLEPLVYDTTRYHIIRITHAWRIFFVWRSGDVYDVDLVRSDAYANPMMGKEESELLPPIHPGDILLQDFMRPRRLGIDHLASAMRMPASQIGAVVYGKLGVTAEAADGLGEFFGTTASLWMNLQRDYDLQVGESAKLAAIDSYLNGICGSSIRTASSRHPIDS